MRDNLFTNQKKLCYWSERIKNIEKDPKPISLVVALTGRCNWSCDYCYLGDQQPKDLDYDKLTDFIYHLWLKGGLKSIEITGGEPTLYKKLDNLIKGCYHLGLKIGITTNGSYLHKLENLDKFDWIRISISEYYDKKEFPDFSFIPDNVYLGFNLIFHKDIQNDFSFSYLRDFLDYNPNAKYMRISLDRDCSVVTSSFYNRAVKQYENRDYRIKFRPQIKTETYEGKCYCGFLKPILEWDGNVYNCVAELEMFGHHSPHVITDIDHPEKLLKYPKDRKLHCKYCFYKDRNEFVKNILNPLHSEFL